VLVDAAPSRGDDRIRLNLAPDMRHDRMSVWILDAIPGNQGRAPANGGSGRYGDFVDVHSRPVEPYFPGRLAAKPSRARFDPTQILAGLP
jgi:hypothetical protein